MKICPNAICVPRCLLPHSVMLLVLHDLSPHVSQPLSLHVDLCGNISSLLRCGSEPRWCLSRLSADTVTLFYPGSLRQSRLKSSGDWLTVTSVYTLLYIRLVLGLKGGGVAECVGLVPAGLGVYALMCGSIHMSICLSV